MNALQIFEQAQLIAAYCILLMGTLGVIGATVIVTRWFLRTIGWLRPKRNFHPPSRYR